MKEITKKEIEKLKQTYKKKHNQKLVDKTERILEDGATRLADIFYEQIIANTQSKKRLKNK